MTFVLSCWESGDWLLTGGRRWLGFIRRGGKALTARVILSCRIRFYRMLVPAAERTAAPSALAAWAEDSRLNVRSFFPSLHFSYVRSVIHNATYTVATCYNNNVAMFGFSASDYLDSTTATPRLKWPQKQVVRFWYYAGFRRTLALQQHPPRTETVCQPVLQGGEPRQRKRKMLIFTPLSVFLSQRMIFYCSNYHYSALLHCHRQMQRLRQVRSLVYRLPQSLP